MSSGNSSRVRLTVFKRDNWTCRQCGFRQTEVQRAKAARHGRELTQYLTIDHIVPRSKGGCNRLENLQTLCNLCNGAKGNQVSPADVIPVRVSEKRKLAELAHTRRRGRGYDLPVHDPRCDAEFCFHTCPVYLEGRAA